MDKEELAKKWSAHLAMLAADKDEAENIAAIATEIARLRFIRELEDHGSRHQRSLDRLEAELEKLRKNDSDH